MLSKEQLKAFIIDYYNNVSYDILKSKYGLSPKEADKLWDETLNKI